MAKPTLAAAVALFVSACTAASQPATTLLSVATTTQVTEDSVAATVNGVDIMMSRVNALHPFREGMVSGDVLAALLRDVIIQEIAIQAAEEQFGIVRDEAEVDGRYVELRQSIEEDLGVPFEVYLAQEGRTDAAVREIAFQNLMREKVMDALGADLPPLTDEQLQQEYELQLPALTQICLSRIIVETEAEARAALARLTGGEAFADVAADVSIERGAETSGGDLGCVPPTAFPDEFSTAAFDAPLGEPSGPVETQFGYHVFLVTSRFVPTLEEAIPLIEAGRFTQMSLMFTDWLQKLVATAVVQVDPELGTWTLLPTPGVAPPSG